MMTVFIYGCTVSLRDSFRRDLHAVDALVDVDGVLAGHHLIDGGAALLLLALLRCHLNNNTATQSDSEHYR